MLTECSVIKWLPAFVSKCGAIDDETDEHEDNGTLQQIAFIEKECRVFAVDAEPE
jgi:hypothetical protein